MLTPRELRDRSIGTILLTFARDGRVNVTRARHAGHHARCEVTAGLQG